MRGTDGLVIETAESVIDLGDAAAADVMHIDQLGISGLDQLLAVLDAGLSEQTTGLIGKTDFFKCDIRKVFLDVTRVVLVFSRERESLKE